MVMMMMMIMMIMMIMTIVGVEQRPGWGEHMFYVYNILCMYISIYKHTYYMYIYKLSIADLYFSVGDKTAVRLLVAAFRSPLALQPCTDFPTISCEARGNGFQYVMAKWMVYSGLQWGYQQMDGL